MSWVMITCAAGWLNCVDRGLVSEAQCRAVMGLGLPTIRTMCVSDTGGVYRSKEFVASR
jgi:hypothetical protein